MKLGTAIFLQVIVLLLIGVGIYLIWSVSWKLVVGAFSIMFALKLIETVNVMTGHSK